MNANSPSGPNDDLGEILIDMVLSSDPETTIKQMLVWCTEQIHGTYGALFLYDPSQETLQYTVSHGVPIEWDEQLRSRPSHSGVPAVPGRT